MEWRVLSSVLNLQVQSKRTEAVDFVFGDSAFWNPTAKAKAQLFAELKSYIGREFEDQFQKFGCNKIEQDELQYLEVWSFHPREYNIGNGAQRNHHVIDKVRDGRGLTKLKWLTKLQWLHKGGNVNLISIQPTFLFDPRDLDLRTNPFKGGGDDASMVEPKDNLEEEEVSEWM